MSTKVNLTSEQKQELIIIKRTNKSSLVRDRAQVVLARSEQLKINNRLVAKWRDKIDYCGFWNFWN
jgi:hypothetical protein